MIVYLRPVAEKLLSHDLTIAIKRVSLFVHADKIVSVLKELINSIGYQ